jgi:protein TonB
MMQRPTFTFLHWLLVSLALHASAALLLLLLSHASTVPRVDETLVVEFQGVDSDVQAQEQNQQQNKGADGADESRSRQAGAEAVEEPETKEPQRETADAVPAPTRQKEIGGASSSAQAGAPGSAQTQGAERRQSAQTIQRSAERQMDELRSYVRGLSKKIQSELVYPKEGRRAGMQGVATVSFKIMADGSMNGETLHIVESSGKEELDASALKTVRLCSPFAPPPKEISVTMAVTYGRKQRAAP